MTQPCLYRLLIPAIALTTFGACTDDVPPVGLQRLTPEPVINIDPPRSCEAKAKCPNGVTLSCNVDGDGTCSGTDGIGVQCITYNNDGEPVESGGVCGG